MQPTISDNCLCYFTRVHSVFLFPPLVINHESILLIYPLRFLKPRGNTFQFWNLLGFMWLCVFEGINRNAHIYVCSSSACTLSCPGKVHVTQSWGGAVASSSCCMSERKDYEQACGPDMCHLYRSLVRTESHNTVMYIPKVNITFILVVEYCTYGGYLWNFVDFNCV